MENQYWQNPVELELHGSGKLRAITGTRYAIECLLTLWPVGNGKAYQKALSDCRAALNDEKSPEVARASFIGAADEAHIRVHQTK